MLAARLGGLLLPHSLRRQFILALSVLALFMVAGSLTAISALRGSAGASRLLAEDRLDRMQAAQDLLLLTLLIERETRQMREAASLEGQRSSYAGLRDQLASLERLVARLGAAETDARILALHQSGQTFRSTAEVVSQLQEETLLADAAFARSLQEHAEPLLGTADLGAVALGALLYRLREESGRSGVEALRARFVRLARGAGVEARLDPFARRLELIERRETLQQLDRELQRQSKAMLTSARDLSTHFTGRYREAVRQLAETSGRDQRWLLALLVGSLLLAWVVFRYFLGRQVLARLQEVSRHLRGGDPVAGPARVPVRGEDEIAEMARAVERLLDDRQRLAEANEELEGFSYSVSHDLRAPIRHVGGYVDLLRERLSGSLDEQGRHYLDAVSDAASRMGALIEGLLSFLHMRRGELVRTAVDLGALAREVVKELGPLVAGRSIDWKIGDLPHVEADRAMLRIAIANLLSNALKFTQRRSRAEIDVGCVPAPAGLELVFFVRDNGVGFDMKYADKLFRVFQRLHHPDDFAGTGIGLANVRRIVERHGGRTWAEGVPGQGATFYFSLPAPGSTAADRPQRP